MTNKAIKAALDTVGHTDNDSDIKVLSTGVRIKLTPVSGMLIQQAINKIKDPEVPFIYDEDKGRKIDNPNHPQYLKELADVELERGLCRINTTILWGVELVDGLPKDDTWLKKLQFQERQGDIDLSAFDFENDIDKEFAYKKFVAIGNELDDEGLNVDIDLILNLNTVTEDEVAEATNSFQDDEIRRED